MLINIVYKCFYQKNLREYHIGSIFQDLMKFLYKFNI